MNEVLNMSQYIYRLDSWEVAGENSDLNWRFQCTYLLLILESENIIVV